KHIPHHCGNPYTGNKNRTIDDTRLPSFRQTVSRLLHFPHIAADHAFVNSLQGNQLYFSYRFKRKDKETVFCDTFLQNMAMMVACSAGNSTGQDTWIKLGYVLEIGQHGPCLLRRNGNNKTDVDDDLVAIILYVDLDSPAVGLEY